MSSDGHLLIPGTWSNIKCMSDKEYESFLENFKGMLDV
jgi:hypothetical protein